MEIQPVVDDLEAVGLGDDQAQMYIRLLQMGPAKVGELSQFFDSSRSKLYRLLDELAERGFVTKSLERPTVYEAAKPEDVFEIGRNEIERSRKRLDTAKMNCLAALRSIAEQGRHAAPAEHHWNKIEGTAKIYRSLHELSQAAEESLYAVSNHEVTMSTYLPVVEEAWRIAFQRAEDDDLDVRLLFDFEGGKSEQLPEWAHPEEGIEMRTFQADQPVHFVLADESELLMWVRPAPLGTIAKRDDVAVQTNAPGSVFSHKLLFDLLWSDARPVESLKP